MADLTLNQLYTLSTGLTKTNIDKLTEDIGKLDPKDQKKVIGRLLWSIPGGVHKSVYTNKFKTQFTKELSDSIIKNADIDGDGDIDINDLNLFNNAPIDIDNDGIINDNDLAFLKALMTNGENSPEQVIDGVSTEEELFASFINGGEIKLAKSFNIESSIIVESDVVLNLNNQSIVNTKVINNDCTTFEVKNGAKLTIEGNGVVKSVAETSKDYSNAVWANGGYVEIKGGKFENEGDSTDLIYASNGGNIVIEGGIFKAAGPANITDNNGTLNIHSVLNVKDANYKDGTSSIIVKGGTFYNFNPANNLSEGKNTNFVAEGYTVVVNGIENLDCYTSEMGDVIYEVVKK